MFGTARSLTFRARTYAYCGDFRKVWKHELSMNFKLALSATSKNACNCSTLSLETLFKLASSCLLTLGATQLTALGPAFRYLANI
eukprot:3162065-Prymnesium_polylepis.1